MNQFLEAGQIVGTHGIKGEIRVNPWCDSAAVLAGIKKLYFKENADPIKAKSRPHKNIVLMKIDGIDTIEEAEKLKGTMLYLNRDDLPLDEGSFFVQDIIGMSVIDFDSGEKYGEIVEVSNLGASDLYHMKALNGGGIILIPAIPDIVMTRDFDEKILRIKPMAGLFED